MYSMYVCHNVCMYVYVYAMYTPACVRVCMGVCMFICMHGWCLDIIFSICRHEGAPYYPCLLSSHYAPPRTGALGGVRMFL